MDEKKCIIDLSAIDNVDLYSQDIETILEEYTPLFFFVKNRILKTEESCDYEMIYKVKSRVCDYLSSKLYSSIQEKRTLSSFNNKSKILKISDSCEVSTYLLYSTKLAMIEGVDSFTGWRMNNFVNIKMYYNPNYINYFFFEEALDDVIEVNRKTYCDMKECSDIVAFTRDAIDNDFFVDIHLDEFFLEKKDFYEKEHFVHENLIYGYDDTEKKFYAYGFVKNQSIKKFSITYDSYRLSYEIGKIFYWKGAGYLHGDYPYPIDIRKINYQYTTEFDLAKFVNNLRGYVFPSMDEVVEGDIHIYGNNVCKHVADSIIIGEKFVDFRCINLLYEHKLCLNNRFLYIMRQYNAKEELHDEYLRFQKIFSAYRNLRLQYLKQLMKENKDKIILSKSIIDKDVREFIGMKIYKIHYMEREILTDLIKKIECIYNNQSR